jgi:hypothetical protein
MTIHDLPKLSINEMEEYDKLIETLQKTENPQLVDNSVVDHNSKSHPSLTNRLMFLHRNLKTNV